MPPPPPVLAALLAQSEPATTEPEKGAVGRWVYERTDSEAWSDVATWVVDIPFRLALIWGTAWIVSRVLRRLIRRFSDRLVGSVDSGRLGRARAKAPSLLVSTEVPSVRSAARATTITGVLKGITSALVYAFAAIYSLDVLGVNLGPLIAGAGIAGVALGFGAQSLVRDFLAGTFILIEDQYGVGDTVDLGEAVGVVEAVNLRTTRLRDVNGTVWHVPNGEILRVGNQSQQWARAVFDIVVEHGTDVDRALAIMKDAADVVSEREDVRNLVLEEAEVWGVEALTPQGITLRLVIKTLPGSQWKVLRVLRQEIRVALRREGVGLAPPAVPGTVDPGARG
jgi:small conductance mechanosensitive channel